MADTQPRGASGSLRGQLYTDFSPQRDQSLTMSLLSRVKHLYRYVYDTHIYRLIQGINNLFLFFSVFFFLDYFYPRPVPQSNSPCSCTNSYVGVTEGLSQGKEQVARAVPAKTDLPAKRSDYKATPLETPAALAKKCHLKVVLFLVINLS